MYTRVHTTTYVYNAIINRRDTNAMIFDYSEYSSRRGKNHTTVGRPSSIRSTPTSSVYRVNAR